MSLQPDPGLGLPGSARMTKMWCAAHQPVDQAQVGRIERALAVSGVVEPANLLQQMGN